MRPFAAFATFPVLDALREALVAEGLPADLYQDGTSGGLLCVSVLLLDVPVGGDARIEYQPHLLISTEDGPEGTPSGDHGARLIEYHGCLYGVGADENYDTVVHSLQRVHLGETAADVARSLAPVLRVLRAGVQATIDTSSSASRQHFIDTGRYLLQGESF